MKRLDKVYKKDFLYFEDINKWIKEQKFDVMVINIQEIEQEYCLFYGKVINPNENF